MAKGSLGVLFSELSGKRGAVVYVRTRNGVVVRPRVSGRNPCTPAQVAARVALGKAAVAYKKMTLGQAAAWREYALTRVKHDALTGRDYCPSAVAVFTSLASKLLQLAPEGDLPLMPPGTDFAGDVLAVGAVGGAEGVTFTADGANAAGVTTELLLQSLVSRNRTPQAKGYRTKGFQTFADGAPGVLVRVSPGWYAVAYRFVNVQTGQESGLVIGAMVQVG